MRERLRVVGQFEFRKGTASAVPITNFQVWRFSAFYEKDHACQAAGLRDAVQLLYVLEAQKVYAKFRRSI